MSGGPGGPVVLDGLDAVRAAVGRELGPTGWVVVDRQRVDLFARATGTEPGADTVPPLLLLSLTNLLMPELVEVRGVSAGVNYGTGPVAFPTELPVGGRVRARATVVATDEVRGGVQTAIRITVEGTGPGDGSPRPACVVDALSRWLG